MSQRHPGTGWRDDPFAQLHRGAIWIRCLNFCDEFWCVEHHMHAFECPCPPIEEWDYSPYEDVWTQ